MITSFAHLNKCMCFVCTHLFQTIYGFSDTFWRRESPRYAHGIQTGKTKPEQTPWFISMQLFWICLFPIYVFMPNNLAFHHWITIETMNCYVFCECLSRFKVCLPILSENERNRKRRLVRLTKNKCRGKERDHEKKNQQNCRKRCSK